MKKILGMLILVSSMNFGLSAEQYILNVNNSSYEGRIVEKPVEPTNVSPPPDITGTMLNTYRSYYNNSTIRAQNIVELTYGATHYYAYNGNSGSTFSISADNVFTFNITSSFHGTGVFNGYVFEGIPNLSGISNVQHSGALIPVTVENGILYFNVQGINPSTTSITMQLEFNN